MLDKIEFYYKILAKIKFLRLTMMYLWISYKKNLKKIIFFTSFKVIEERSRIRSWIRIRIH